MNRILLKFFKILVKKLRFRIKIPHLETAIYKMLENLKEQSENSHLKS